VDNSKKEQIQNTVLTSFQKAVSTTLEKNNGSRIKTVHVSDFVSPCLRKSYYNQHITDSEQDTIKNKVLFMGVILHEHTKLSHFHEVTMCYDIVNDRSMTPQDVEDLKDPAGIITGTLDDLVKVGNEFVIVDKKTWNARGFVKTEPDESYFKQLSIYRVLLKESYNIDAKYGCLLYLDKSNDLNETPLAFELASINETKQFLRQTYNELTCGMPPPTITYLCNGKNKFGRIYCPYLEQCKKDGRDVG